MDGYIKFPSMCWKFQLGLRTWLLLTEQGASAAPRAPKRSRVVVMGEAPCRPARTQDGGLGLGNLRSGRCGRQGIAAARLRLVL